MHLPDAFQVVEIHYSLAVIHKVVVEMMDLS